MRQDANPGTVRASRRRLPRCLKFFGGWPKLSSLPYRILRRVGYLRYARYLMVSALSLAADLTVFFVLLHLQAPVVEASILGYVSGLVVHWLLSSRLVFADKVHPVGAARKYQQLLFAVSAFVGLVITAVIIKGGLMLGWQPGLSKLAAIAVSFHVTYILRRTFIFI